MYGLSEGRVPTRVWKRRTSDSVWRRKDRNEGGGRGAIYPWPSWAVFSSWSWSWRRGRAYAVCGCCTECTPETRSCSEPHQQRSRSRPTGGSALVQRRFGGVGGVAEGMECESAARGEGGEVGTRGARRATGASARRQQRPRGTTRPDVSTGPEPLVSDQSRGRAATSNIPTFRVARSPRLSFYAHSASSPTPALLGISSIANIAPPPSPWTCEVGRGLPPSASLTFHFSSRSPSITTSSQFPTSATSTASQRDPWAVSNQNKRNGGA